MGDFMRRRLPSYSGDRSNSKFVWDVEMLEQRRLLSVFTIINTNAGGTGSLRDAITQANTHGGDDTVNFSPTAFPAGTLTTIGLGGTQLLINDTTGKTTIQGLGPDRVAISGNKASR